MKVLKRQTIMNEREAVERRYGYDENGVVNVITSENLDTGEVTFHTIEIDPETNDKIEVITELDGDHTPTENYCRIVSSFDSEKRLIKCIKKEQKDGVCSSVVFTNTYDDKGRLIKYTKGDNYEENFVYHKDDNGNDLYYKYILEDSVNRLSYMSVDSKHGTIMSKSFDNGNTVHYSYKHGRVVKVRSVIADAFINYVIRYKYNKAGAKIESFHEEYDVNGKLIGVAIHKYTKGGEIIYIKIKDPIDNVERSYEYTHIGNESYVSKITDHLANEITKLSYFVEKNDNKTLLHEFTNGKRTNIKQWVYDDDGCIILYNDPAKSTTIRNEFAEI